eukprot:TRINITY_DN3904_c0_g2_i1.p1 TRINITY_DN3904_c0_g2~~TRINITY_DN3904_c0_g2_i1.p1  ORF type:complete len:175 (-),score=44.72 TRINITY_DN3904_c0_g2_i1:264-788(-)
MNEIEKDPKQMIEYLTKKYNLQPHPEGGFFVQTFEDPQTVDDVRAEGSVKRSKSTHIYFLLTPETKSHLHLIQSSEVWHYYKGDGPIDIVELTEDGTKITKLGPDTFDDDQHLSYVVPPRVWFGSYLSEGTNYALVGCTVAPGFVFEDFQIATKKAAVEEFPNCAEMIDFLCMK